MLLRFLGYDAFVTSKDVVACLRDAGLDIAEAPTSKRDLAKIQEQFNAWAKETALPYRHLSLICAMSIGKNYEPAEGVPRDGWRTRVSSPGPIRKADGVRRTNRAMRARHKL
jgi:hypothetical protein